MHEPRATLSRRTSRGSVASRLEPSPVTNPPSLRFNRLTVQPREGNLLRNLASAFTHYPSDWPDMSPQ